MTCLFACLSGFCGYFVFILLSGLTSRFVGNRRASKGACTLKQASGKLEVQGPGHIVKSFHSAFTKKKSFYQAADRQSKKLSKLFGSQSRGYYPDQIFQRAHLWNKSPKSSFELNWSLVFILESIAHQKSNRGPWRFCILSAHRTFHPARFHWHGYRTRGLQLARERRARDARNSWRNYPNPGQVFF